MRRSLLVLIISGISSGAVASGYALWTYASSSDRAESVAATAVAPPAGVIMKPASSAVAALMPSAPALLPGNSALLAIEVARIDAGGPSVLAGRSPPNHKVTLLANGREIGSATATDEGQWSIIVSDGIAAGPLELSIVSQSKDGGATVRGAGRQLVVPPASASSLAAAALTRPQPAKSAAVDNNAPAPRVGPQPRERPQAEAKSQRPAPAQARAGSDDAAGKRALAEFEALVEKTRKEVAAQRAAPAASPPAPIAQSRPSDTASSTSRVVGASESPASARVPAAPTAADQPSAIPAQSASEQTPASAVPAPTAERSVEPAAMAPGTKVAAAALPAAVPPAAAPRGEPASAVQTPIPVPITFMTDETTLTTNGARAAALLAEYLRLKQPAGVTLSGHADARGPDAYNMRLSLRRLEAIKRYLRAAGYDGKLSLIARGKREPYRGIDRRRLPLREIYQADRRVELRLTP